MVKKLKIRTKNERILISDVLPYETPASFSNRHFYDFLVENKVNTESIKSLNANFPKPFMQQILKAFFITDSKYKNIPFSFKISHKDKESRELSICHPSNQIKVVEFYEKYKNLILYYCNLSPFSIRKPVRVAKYTYYNDKKHQRKQSKDLSLLEEFDKEYQNQKTFFVYKDFSNVHKFYESTKFHRCEKKYSHLLKLDITKCFDSIYTHSIAWALMSKEAVKKDTDATKFSTETFAGQFDSLMQQVNHNETNGIIIGPEFSRIFAELILQAVDVAIEKKLLGENLKHRVNYEIFRYVDDYFVFYNDEQDKKTIVETLQNELKIYKLTLNSAKEENYDKPIITQITIAKEAIRKLLREKLLYENESSINEIKVVCPHQVDLDACPHECKIKSHTCATEPKSKIYIQSNNLITEFKTILKQSNVEYKDIINYTLMLVESHCDDIFNEHKKYLSKYDAFCECQKLQPSADASSLVAEHKKHKHNKEAKLIRALIEIVEFTFFIASVSPKVATTIRLCRINSLIIQYLNNNIEKISDLKHLVFKVIADNIALILKKNKLNKYTQVETLYLLLSLDELGKNYRLPPAALMNYLNIESDDATGKLRMQKDFEFNYFAITVTLLCIKNYKPYKEINDFIKQTIIDKFEKQKTMIRKKTELVLLLLDTIACPYIDKSTKEKLLTLCDILGATHDKIINFSIDVQKAWFTDWTGFKFNKALDAKRSREVY
ncbi:MAG: antiviral reverse transcriptase Drt3b [Methylophilus sp.]